VSRREKLLKTIQNAKGFGVKWSKLCRLMGMYGFELITDKGGSHCFFYNEATRVKQHVVRPHPGNEVHPRMVNDCLDAIERSEGRLRDVGPEKGQND